MAELIIAQSRALAGKYRRYLTDHVGQEGVTIWTWPDLIRDISAAVGAPPTNLLTPLHQALVVREACLSSRSQLRHFGVIATTRGFWLGMERFIAQLRQSQESVGSLVNEPAKAADIQLILDRYQELLTTSGLSDLAERYRRLAEAVRTTSAQSTILPGITELQLVGLAQPTGVQAELLDALSQRGIAYSQRSSLIPASRPERLELVAAAEPYGEVRAVADQVVALLSAGVSLADIALVYPSEQYLVLLRKEFRQRGIPLRASLKQRLLSIPLIRKLLTGYGAQVGPRAAAQVHQARFTEYIAQGVNNQPWRTELSEGGQEEIRHLAAREVRAVESLHELSEEAAAALEVIYGDRTFSAREYTEIVSLSLDQATIWQEPYPGPGLRLIPLTEASIVLAPHLFFVGLSQQVLGRKSQGWLPEVGRLTEPTAVIDLLLAEGPQTANLSYAQADTTGRLLLAPLYFRSLEQWAPVKRQVPYYQPGSEIISQMAPSDLSRPKSLDGDLSSIIDQIYPHPDERRFGVSSLETYLNCPFSFFAQQLLKLQAVEEELGEVQAVDEGSLIHAVLRDFFNQVELPLRQSKSAEYRGLLDKLLAAEIARQRAEYPAVLPGAWEVSHLRLSGFLAGVLREELKATESEDFVPVQLEEPITPVILATAKGEVTLRGRIDRIDSDGAGGWRLIDYKGGEVKKKEITEHKRLQLSIYAAALQRRLVESGADLTSLEVCYFSYRKGKRTLYKPKNLLEAEAWLTEALQVAKAAAEGILAGSFSPSPASEDVCKWCGYSDLCRKGGKVSV